MVKKGKKINKKHGVSPKEPTRINSPIRKYKKEWCERCEDFSVQGGTCTARIEDITKCAELLSVLDNHCACETNQG